MSNFLNNTIDLQKIYNEVKDLDVLIDELQSKFIISGPTIITFSIDNFGEYRAEEGMTWGEWVESEYNTDGYYVGSVPVYGDVICIKDSDSYTWKLMMPSADLVDLWEVTPTDIITNNLYCITERLEFVM